MDYPRQAQEFGRQLLALARDAEDILITTIKADDDGVASLLALYWILTQQFPLKNIKMVNCSYRAERFTNLPLFEQIYYANDLSQYGKDFDLIIFVDNAEYKRFNLELPLLKLQGTKTACLDHHHYAIDAEVFDLSLIERDATSTAELIYYAFVPEQEKVDRALAEMLLVGILGDTGTLKYMDPKRAHLYPIVERLIVEKNIDLSSLVFIWRKINEREFRIVQEFMRHSKLLKSPNWPPYTATFVTREFAENGSFTDIEINEAASFYISQIALAVGSAEWGQVFLPVSNGMVKLKIRTQLSSVNARSVVEGLSIGSGHAWAAGGFFKPENIGQLRPESCLMTVQEWLKTHTYDPINESIKTLAIKSDQFLH